jgi:DNA polymerase-3 subunit epsilon
MNFVAIDFETATSSRNSACSVGIITVKSGVIIDEFHALIKPPNNEYNWHNVQVHGINEVDTRNSPSFDRVFPEIQRRLQNNVIVAHNEAFDRSVLTRTMENYGLEYSELGLTTKWECTMKMYKQKGYPSAKLDFCCNHHGIALKHHDALSDAIGCAKLYMIAKGGM